MSDLHLHGDPGLQPDSPTSTPPLDQPLQQKDREEEEAPPTPPTPPEPPRDRLEVEEREPEPSLQLPQVCDASADFDEGEDVPALQSDVAAVPDIPSSVVEILQMPTPAHKKQQSRTRRKPVRITAKQRAVANQRLEVLHQNFHPIPFTIPSSALDLSKHEVLLRGLGLWGFAHLELDRDPVRPDLLMDLIAYYDPQKTRSFVRGLLIRLSMSDLRRGLALPPACKKEKAGSSSCGSENNAEPCQELYSQEESIAAIEEFMSNFVLFQFQEDDACILPSEVASVHQMVKEGQPHKVDWPKLVCSLVKKELAEVPKHGRFYYASHLQRLIKCQKPALFEDVDSELKLEPVPEEENSVEVPMAEEEEDDELDDAEEEDGLMAKNMDGINDMETAGQRTGLCLGVGVHVRVIDDTTSEHGDEREDEQWLQEDKSAGIDHCLQRCNSSLVGSMEFENLCREDGEVRVEERNADGLSAKFGSFERLTSMDLLQSMDAVHAPYGQPGNSVDMFPGDYLATRDGQKNITLNSPTGGSFFYENNGKRPITEVVPEDDDENMHEFSQTNQPKRMRMDDIWEHSPSNFDACMDQVQSILAKAKILHVEKMQESMNAHLQLQYMGAMIQEKDQMIGSLEKERMEDREKWRLQICRFEHELSVMADLAFGYKKALMHTRASFAEYRKKFPQGEEPLYKDADGTGGLVLSVKELELLRMQKDEEMRRNAELLCNEFEMQWLPKFEEFNSRLSLLDRLIEEFVLEFKILQERFRKMKQ